MRACALFVPAVFCVLAVLPGCGSPEPEKPVEAPKAKVVIPPPSDPKPADADKPGKGMGKSKDDIMKGLAPDLKVEDADLPSPDGNTFMGHTSDFSSGMPDPAKPDTAANLLVYGNLTEVRRVFYNAPASFIGNPDPSTYPDWQQRNLRLAETLLGNIFGSPLPDEVKAGMEFIKTVPDRNKWVQLNGRIALFSYSSSKKSFTVDVK